MKAPLSWLQDYVTITTEPKKLGDKLTEVGLGTENIIVEKGDVIFDLEITPNRPDCLSIIGVAREIAAIEGKKATPPKLKTTFPKPTKHLPITIHPNFAISERISAVIITGITVKDSPDWLKNRLVAIGLRPINNIVDITNYVMKELGNPIHSFDYDKIKGHEMWVKQAKGGEVFESVDELTYHLPKGAIIYEDQAKVIDLVGIKGGKNTGTYTDTKTVLITVPVDDPILIRRASLALALRSDASAIFERSVNKGGTVDALKRTTDLILELASGEIASGLIDLKEKEFEPWKLTLRIERMNKILGVELSLKKVEEILDSLNLSPKLKKDVIEVIVPTYRNDLQIEEDLIEEVARLYGYNNFPKTMPEGGIPTTEIPYFKNYKIDEKIKRFLASCGFSEIYSYSLISETDLLENAVDPQLNLRVDNPVSREFEYLRPTLLINLRKAAWQNRAIAKDVNLFELGKVYLGKTVKEAEEINMLSGISTSKSFYEVKGMLESLLKELAVDFDPTSSIEITEDGISFELNMTEILKKVAGSYEKSFTPVAKFPPIVEDLSFTTDPGTKTGAMIAAIKKQSNIIVSVKLIDMYKDSRAFHITYQHKERNLTTEEVKEIREKIVAVLKEQFHATLKG